MNKINPKELAEKIDLNSHFPAHANNYFYFFDPEVVAKITAKGRKIIKRTK